MDKKEIIVRIFIGTLLVVIFVVIYLIGKIQDRQIGNDIERMRSEIGITTTKRDLKNEYKRNEKQKPQINCIEFKNGYKEVLWDWDKSNIISYFKSQDFHIEDESIYNVSNGRSALSLHFRKGSYSDYRSERQMKERFINLVNDSIYQIEFSNHFNWNYNFQMAYDVAKEVADKYNLPKRSDQTVGFGAKNIVWFDDCPDFRVIVRLFWDPNIIDGEANRYLVVNIFNVEKDNKFREIQDIRRIEKHKKRTNNFLKEF